MELILFFLFLICWFGLLGTKKENGGKYSTVFIFGLGVLFYFFSIPLEMYFRGEVYYQLGSLWVRVGDQERIKILSMGLLSFIGFLLGLYLSRFSIRVPSMKIVSPFVYSHEAYHKRDFEKVLWVIWFISALIVFMIYRDVLISMDTYQSAYIQSYSSPLFSYSISQFYICSSILAGLAFWESTRKAYLLGVCLLCVNLLLAFYTSNKDPILLSLLAIASSVLGKKRIGTVKVLILILIAFPAVLLIMPIFSLYRSGIPLSSISLQLLGDHISFTMVDPAGPMIAISHNITNPPPFRFGSTYITSIGVLVPKILWSNRPLDLAEQFAHEQIPNWLPGQGLGFSPIAEAFINFGILGSFFHFFMFALIWGLGWKFLQRSLFSYKQEHFLIFYQVVGFYALILSFRGPLISPLKTLFIFIVPFFIAFYFIRMLRVVAHKEILAESKY